MSKPQPNAFTVAVNAAAEKSKRNLKSIAGRMGVQYGTLRAWLNRKSLPRDACTVLCHLLGWDEDVEVIRERFGLKWARHRAAEGGHAVIPAEPTAGDLLRQLVAKDQEFARYRVASTFADYTALMRKGDFFAYTSVDREPLEAVNRYRTELSTTLTQAIANEACLLYIVPEWNTKMVEDLMWFRETVQEDLVREVKMRPAAAKARVTTRLLICPIDACDLWTPGFSFCLHQAADSQQLCVQRCSVRLPDDFSSEVLHAANDGSLTGRMLELVKSTLTRFAERPASEMGSPEKFLVARLLVEANERRRRKLLRPG